MTQKHIENGINNGFIKFNRVRLNIEYQLQKLDSIVLQYLPDIKKDIEYGFLKFLTFKRGPVTTNELRQHKDKQIYNFVTKEPLLAFLTPEIVIEALMSRIHKNGEIYETNKIVDSLLGNYNNNRNMLEIKCFTQGYLDIIDIFESQFCIELSLKDIELIEDLYCDIESIVLDYTDVYPSGIFEFDYIRNYVDLIYVGDIYQYRYEEAMEFLNNYLDNNEIIVGFGI